MKALRETRLSKIFGTHPMPENGRFGGHPVPKGYWQHFLHPFWRKKK